MGLQIDLHFCVGVWATVEHPGRAVELRRLQLRVTIFPNGVLVMGAPGPVAEHLLRLAGAAPTSAVADPVRVATTPSCRTHRGSR